MRHEDYIIPGCPAQMLPELPRLDVLATHEEVTLGDTEDSQPLQNAIRETGPQTLAAVSWGHCQVLEIPSPAICPSQYSTNQPVTISGHKTKPRITGQIVDDDIAGINLPEREPFSCLPQGHDLVIVRRCEGENLDHRCLSAPVRFDPG